jgi:uncharacterized membrane protein
MSIAGLTVSAAERSSRWLLLVSLALNLFFIGAGGALLLQGGSGGGTAEVTVDRSVGGRIERIAATLPREDSDKLRAAYQANRNELDETNTVYRSKQEMVRAALRAQPFDIDALRAAMADMQAARQDYDRRLQGFFARVAADISPAGREKLAAWRSRPAPAPSKEGGR